MTPDQILTALDYEVAQSSVDYKFIALTRDDAGNNPGFTRVKADIPISAELFDAFLNSRTDYRTQYFDWYRLG
jgi:hypothetical protein